MRMKNMRSMFACLLSSFRLAVKRKISFQFIAGLLFIKALRAIGVQYLIISYNKNLKYLCPLDQPYDWYHITTGLLDFDEAFEPREGEVVVDVGANIGLYSLYCAQRVGPNGTVVAIEPEPANFFNLLENIVFEWTF